ncbi:MAG: hypothetical protein JW717_11980 [Marinilabiliaceae bacterium]|nr:hypothetical protein [Marinilabiliaceae bacterium]
MNNLIDFFKKNWLVIVGVLLLILVLQWCKYRPDILYSDKSEIASEKQITTQSDPLYHAPYEKTPEDDKSPMSNQWLQYLVMVGLVLFVFVAQRRGWFEKIMPALILVRIKIYKHRSSKRRMLQIFFLNTTKSGQTFDAPVVEFVKPGSVKSYRINVNNNPYSFPITLANNTSHKVVIDLEQFYEKIIELKSYRWVRVKVMVNGTVVKKTLLKFVW